MKIILKNLTNLFFFSFFIIGISFSASAGTMDLIKTGVSALDDYLNGVDEEADSPFGVIRTVDEINRTLNLSITDIFQLSQNGFRLSEIYYLGLLRNVTGRSIDDVIANRQPGQGWGVLAHQLGVHPSVLNKRRVALQKQYKSSNKVTFFDDDDELDDDDDDQVGPGHGKGKDKEKGKGKPENPGQGKGKNK